MRAAVRLFLALRPDARKQIAGLVALSLLVTATYVGQGLMIARLLAGVFQDDPLGQMAGHLIAIAVLQAVRTVVIVVRDGWALRVSAGVKEAVREALTRKLLEIGPGQAQRMRTGELQSSIVDAVELLDPLIGRFVPQVYAALIGACLAGGYVIAVDPAVGVVLLTCALLAPLSKVIGSRWIQDRGDAWSLAYRELYADNLDAVQGMATLKAFNASRRRGRELQVRADAFCRDSIRLMAAWSASASIAELLVPLGTSAGIGLAAWHAASGTLTLTGLFIVLMLTRETFRPMQELQSAYHMSYAAIPASSRIAELLRLEPDVRDVAAPALAAPVLLVAEPPGLEFRGVHFNYPARSTPALRGFDLTVEPGERLAIVGRSGAGKSTVLALLLRYFDPDAGTIRIGGHDLKALPLANLRSLVGVVAQDTYLFHGTVRDNLAIACPGTDEAAYVAAAKAARAHDFVTALPDGYDTVVGERGLRLSGGERQRIAIARALLKDAPVLVLDEPTSSIDAANETEIHRALSDLTRGRTTIVVAHRLSTVRDADRIVVMEGGLVVETGSHDTLLTASGAYAELVATQSGAAAT